MYKATHCIAILGLFAGTVAAQPAQEVKPSSQSGKDSKDATRVKQPPKDMLDAVLPNWLRISVTARGRWEDGVTNMVGNVTDNYYLSRLRLDVQVKPVSWLSFYTQIQDARAMNYDKGQPAASMQDPLDLRLAYVQLGNSGEGSGQWIRVGRQEIQYGNQRIFGNGDWSNAGREFDAVRARYYRPGASAEFIAGSVVLQDPSRFDRHKPGEHFYGTYDTFDRIVPGASVEPYFFLKTTLNVAGETGSHGNSSEYVTGLRFAGKLPGRFDYALEALHEGGNYATDHISAFGAVYSAGWTVTRSHWTPRISADYDYASGDNNTKDGVRGTFDQMYGNPQPFFSVTGLFGWKNLREYREGIDFVPRKNVKIIVDYRDYNLATIQDGLYNGPGTRVFLNRKATSDHVGDGVETRIAITWPRAITTSFGVGALFSGTYLHQSAQYGTYLYPYFTWVKRF